MKYLFLLTLVIASASAMDSKKITQLIKPVKHSGMDSIRTPDHVKHSGSIGSCTIV